MTRDEAVNYLTLNKPSSGYPGLCEAIDMAIAALRSRPAPPDDLRNALDGLLALETERSKAQGLRDCTCVNWSHDTERAYEAGRCPHQIARAVLAAPVAAPAPETPAPDAMPEKRGHQIVARDRDGMPWCETCRKWGVREDGPCDRTYPGSTGRRQEAQP